MSATSSARAQPAHRHHLASSSRSSPYWRMPSVSIQPGATQTTPMSYSPPLHRQHAGQRLGAGPRRRRVHHPGDAARRAQHDRDDAAAAVLDHPALRHLLGQVPGRVQVEPPHRRPAVGRDLLGRRHELAAGVVDQHVDAAEPLQREVDQRVRHLGLADVAGQRQAVVLADPPPAPPPAARAGARRSPAWQPSRCSASAAARPMPVPPPVTIATRLTVGPVALGRRAPACPAPASPPPAIAASGHRPPTGRSARA